MPADKLDAPVLLHPLALPQQYQTDLPGPRDVRAAAGLAVAAFDLNRAQDTFAVHRLADARFGQLLRCAEANGNRPVGENDFVRAPLGRGEMLGRDLLRGQINRGDFTSQMKGHGWELEQAEKHRREDVLASVLLHVVE